MKILIVHNKYKEAGGEDVVFQSEQELLSENGNLVETLVFDNSKIRTVMDGFVSALKMIYNPDSARLLRLKIESFNPDIIHVHNFVPLASPSVFFVARRSKIPVVLTLHNYRLICPSATLFHKNKIYEKSIHSIFPLEAIVKGVYRNSCLQTAAVVIMTAFHKLIGTWKNRIDLYITLTKFARKQFEVSAVSIPPYKLLVKPNFATDHGQGNARRKDFFLFVGRLTEEKGVRTLLTAARRANFRLVIIGDGPLKDLILDFVKEYPNVSYLGFLDKARVIDHIKTCKALIFPSLWYEGFPMTIVEALSAGTIVIASKLGGMAEIIQHNVNGLHFEASNADDLVSRIEEIEREPAHLESMSAMARISYLEHYTPQKNYSLLMEIYNYALTLKRRPEKKQIYDPLRHATSIV